MAAGWNDNSKVTLKTSCQTSSQKTNRHFRLQSRIHSYKIHISMYNAHVTSQLTDQNVPLMKIYSAVITVMYCFKPLQKLYNNVFHKEYFVFPSHTWKGKHWIYIIIRKRGVRGTAISDGLVMESQGSDLALQLCTGWQRSLPKLLSGGLWCWPSYWPCTPWSARCARSPPCAEVPGAETGERPGGGCLSASGAGCHHRSALASGSAAWRPTPHRVHRRSRSPPGLATRPAGSVGNQAGVSRLTVEGGRSGLLSWTKIPTKTIRKHFCKTNEMKRKVLSIKRN